MLKVSVNICPPGSPVIKLLLHHQSPEILDFSTFIRKKIVDHEVIHEVLHTLISLFTHQCYFTINQEKHSF